ncbi:MAG: HAD family phosphatase [Actinomycetota bacterium]
MLNAVIWDCDGVLVDSEPLADALWGRVVGDRGYTMTDEDADACRGRNEVATYDYFAERADLLPFDEHMAALDAIRVPLFEEHLEAFADSEDTVRALAGQGIPMAVASSSRRHALDEKLALTGLDRYFDAIAGGNEVPAAKPAPDVYLEAAKRLGIAPKACLAIEDSETGATAAVAAGMRVIMIKRDGMISPNHSTVTEITPDLVLSWMGR